MNMTRAPESLVVSAAEFESLLDRAGLKIKPEWREQMLIEYAQLRMNMDVIHELADTCAGTVNIRQPITYGRIEE